jgi:hypothetical protein
MCACFAQDLLWFRVVPSVGLGGSSPFVQRLAKVTTARIAFIGPTLLKVALLFCQPIYGTIIRWPLSALL